MSSEVAWNTPSAREFLHYSTVCYNVKMRWEWKQKYDVEKYGHNIKLGWPNFIQ
jgi:hypothetical protein